jgi:hypothetical protein
MKRFACLAVIAVTMCFGDQASDRVAIEKTISASLFAKDADAAEVEHFSKLQAWLKELAQQPATEASPAKSGVSINTVKFISADVVLVDGETTMAAYRIPVMFVVKREAVGWRIEAVRLMTALRGE